MGRLLQHRPPASGAGRCHPGGTVQPAATGSRRSAGVGFGGSRGARPGRARPARAAARDGDGWVSRKVGRNGIVCVAWQQVSVGKHRAGSRCDVLVTDQLLQFWIGEELLKTVQRASPGEVRKKHAEGTSKKRA